MKLLKIAFIGFCMGAVDVIPGVSGGTMALVLGIYERLIAAIHAALQWQTVEEVVTGKFKTVYKRIDATFLLSLASGIGIGIVTIARVLESALLSYPQQMWGVFFGAVLYSMVLVAKRVSSWNKQTIALFIVAVLVAWLIVSVHSFSTPNTWWMLIATGMIASCAMILPGISGAFLLVILNKYETIVQAVNNRDLLTIGLVGIGAIIGIGSFAWVLRILLRQYHDRTFAVLAGLLLGSVWRLWPWKFIPTDVQSTAILPPLTPETIGTIVCILGGGFAVWCLYYFSREV